MSLRDAIAADVAEHEVNTHPDAPERAAGAARRSQCQPCKRLGLFQVAHRVQANGDGICKWHYHGELPPASAFRRQPPGAASHILPSNEGTREEVMEEKRQCGESGCGKALRANNRSGYCTKHF